MRGNGSEKLMTMLPQCTDALSLYLSLAQLPLSSAGEQVRRRRMMSRSEQTTMSIKAINISSVGSSSGGGSSGSRGAKHDENGARFLDSADTASDTD